MRLAEDGLRLSAIDFAEHLACRHLTQIERARAEGRLHLSLPLDPRHEALRNRGHAHEQAYVDALRADGRSVVDLRHAARSRPICYARDDGRWARADRAGTACGG
jgi:uncharacterized protein